MTATSPTGAGSSTSPHHRGSVSAAVSRTDDVLRRRRPVWDSARRLLRGRGDGDDLDIEALIDEQVDERIDVEVVTIGTAAQNLRAESDASQPAPEHVIVRNTGVRRRRRRRSGESR